MKLRRIRLENVRRFAEAVEIGPVADGLNVLSAPNESGKSTVFDALHALFFLDRNSQSREVRSLVPHAGGDPSVALDLDIEGEPWRVEKTWRKSRRGEARVFRDGRLVAQADDAEAWLAATVRAPKEGGPAGLLWVRQGLVRLDQDAAGAAVRRDLLGSVAGEVEAMTGGRRLEGLRRRVAEDLGRYVTGRRAAPRTGGPLKEAEDRVAHLTERRDTLAAQAASLRRRIDRRREARRELAEIVDPAHGAERRARLDAAAAAHDVAERHADRLARAEEAERAAALAATRASERLRDWDAAVAEAEA
ncbi:MAG: AAA family ATPase, partial [Paracoccaceae bacterium]